MIKLIVAVKKRDDLSPQAFAEHWKTTHATKVLASAAGKKYIRKYTQCIVPASLYAQAEPSYDGTAELWFDSLEDMNAFYSDPDYVENVKPDEPNFANMEKTKFFVTEENFVIPEKSATAFVENFFSVIDSMHSKNFANLFAEDGKFYFANNPPAEGRHAIAELAQGVFNQLKGIKHDLVDLSVIGDKKLMFEGRVTYLRKDSREIALPFACSLLKDSEGLVREYRSYVDVAPLFS